MQKKFNKSTSDETYLSLVIIFLYWLYTKILEQDITWHNKYKNHGLNCWRHLDIFQHTVIGSTSSSLQEK